MKVWQWQYRQYMAIYGNIAMKERGKITDDTENEETSRSKKPVYGAIVRAHETIQNDTQCQAQFKLLIRKKDRNTEHVKLVHDRCREQFKG